MKKVEITLGIRTKPETIIEAFINPEMLEAWWEVERCYIDTKVGGLYALTWQVSAEGFKYLSVGTIKTYQPQSQLVLNNMAYFNTEKDILGNMTLTLIAKQNGELTQLYLCQEGYQDGETWDWYYQAVKEAWPQVLQVLKDYLERL